MTIRNALFVAAGMLLFALAVNLAERGGYIGDETARRAGQVLLGLLVVAYANLAPKTLEPLSGACDPGRVQTLQRFSGWTLVLGGLGYCLAWTLAPLDYARPASILLLGGALLVVTARCLWTYLTRGQGRPPSEA